MKIFTISVLLFFSLNSFAMRSVQESPVDGHQTPFSCIVIAPDEFVDELRNTSIAKIASYSNLKKVAEITVSIGNLIYAENYKEALKKSCQTFMRLFDKFKTDYSKLSTDKRTVSCEEFAFVSTYNRVILGVSDQPRSFHRVFEGCGCLAYYGDLKSLGYIADALSNFHGDLSQTPQIIQNVLEVSE